MNGKICRSVLLAMDNRCDTSGEVVTREEGPFWLKEDIRYRVSPAVQDYYVEWCRCIDKCALTAV